MNVFISVDRCVQTNFTQTRLYADMNAFICVGENADMNAFICVGERIYM